MSSKITLSFLSALAGGLVALFVYTRFNEPRIIVFEQAAPQNSRRVSDVPRTDFTAAAHRTLPAVVHIRAGILPSTGISLFDYLFGVPSGPMFYSSGSGVILSTDGYIVTNYHVVENNTPLEVVLYDKRSFPARLIGFDKLTDLALLKIDADSLPNIVLGNSDELEPGQWVLAVGNPFNLNSTVTAGIISAKGRNINIYDEETAIEAFIQTDAAINPGNSGGALVNADGELIGINTAIASYTGSYSGYSFAIPVSIVKKVVTDLIEYGIVNRAMLGVQAIEMTPQLAKRSGMNRIEGVYVSEVEAQGPAGQAGLKAGDIILQIEGRAINTVPEFQEQMNRFSPGDKIMLQVSHHGQRTDLHVILRSPSGSLNYRDEQLKVILGAEFEDLEAGLSSGVRVRGLTAGKLLSAGVKEGFVITHVNREKIENTEEFFVRMRESHGGIFIEGLYPGGETAYYAFGMR